MPSHYYNRHNDPRIGTQIANLAATSPSSTTISPMKSQYTDLMAKVMLSGSQNPVVRSPSQGLNKLLQAFLAGKLMEKSDKDRMTSETEYYSKLGEALNQGYLNTPDLMVDPDTGTSISKQNLSHQDRMERLLRWGMESPENMRVAKEAMDFVSTLKPDEYTLGSGMGRYRDGELIAERSLSAGGGNLPADAEMIEYLVNTRGYSPEEAETLVLYSKSKPPREARLWLIDRAMNIGFKNVEDAMREADEVISHVYGTKPHPGVPERQPSKARPGIMGRAGGAIRRLYEGATGREEESTPESPAGPTSRPVPRPVPRPSRVPGSTPPGPRSSRPSPQIHNPAAGVGGLPGEDFVEELPLLATAPEGRSRIDRSKLIVNHKYRHPNGSVVKWTGKDFVQVE